MKSRLRSKAIGAAALTAFLVVQPGTAGAGDAVSRDASELSQQPTEKSDRKFPRAFNTLAVSLAYQAPLSLDKSFAGGGGFSYTRSYLVGARTLLGIHAAVRVFPASPTHWALGYGLTIAHYVTGPRSDVAGWYLLYGLLLQMNFLADRGGSATGHDTRLSVGYDWRVDELFPLVEVGYHLTQVRSFESDTIWWPYAELVGGLRF